MNKDFKHAHQPIDSADDKIKQKLRAHITKVLKKITRGGRPVAALDKSSRLLSAVPGLDPVGLLASVQLGAGLLGSP